MLTETEINKIFSWQPYRKDWPVDRNQIDDNIEEYYGDLIKALTKNQQFETYYTDDGSYGNYLEFVCFPAGHKGYIGNAILLCISLCSPICAYGQTTVHKEASSFGWSFISPETIGVISDNCLLEIEKEILKIVAENNLSIIDKEFASRLLPVEVAQHIKYENHNEGNQYLHGLFQKND